MPTALPGIWSLTCYFRIPARCRRLPGHRIQAAPPVPRASVISHPETPPAWPEIAAVAERPCVADDAVGELHCSIGPPDEYPYDKA
jgi:hypothetical protein